MQETQETQIWYLGGEDPLEEEMATHSNILTWRIPWTVQSMGSQRVRQDWAILTYYAIQWYKTEACKQIH